MSRAISRSEGPPFPAASPLTPPPCAPPAPSATLRASSSPSPPNMRSSSTLGEALGLLPSAAAVSLATTTAECLFRSLTRSLDSRAPVSLIVPAALCLLPYPSLNPSWWFAARSMDGSTRLALFSSSSPLRLSSFSDSAKRCIICSRSSASSTAWPILAKPSGTTPLFPALPPPPPSLSLSLFLFLPTFWWYRCRQYLVQNSFSVSLLGTFAK
mmetsp:Transcript_1983/g.6643  ORF Transcript_1983/g.6643 Transcript_1983/m.6643 type:complete len:213 (-) Transcript_1983:766-1404(-)